MRNVENIWNIHDADSAAVEDPAAYLWKDQNPGKETLHKLVRIPQYLQPPKPPIITSHKWRQNKFYCKLPFFNDCHLIFFGA